MKTIRDLINLLEDEPTNGMLPAAELAKLLPEVDNINYFSSALLKIENGQEGTLILQEKDQLTKAFVSLIRLPDAQKTLVVQKMMPVSQPTPSKQKL